MLQLTCEKQTDLSFTEHIFHVYYNALLLLILKYFHIEVVENKTRRVVIIAPLISLPQHARVKMMRICSTHREFNQPLNVVGSLSKKCDIQAKRKDRLAS